MKHEKTLIRENGLKVRITVELRIDWQETYWSTIVETCQPKKRTWINTHDSDLYSFRRLATRQEKNQAILAQHLNHVTLAELEQARLELWQQIKPEPIYVPGQLLKTD